MNLEEAALSNSASKSGGSLSVLSGDLEYFEPVTAAKTEFTSQAS